MAQGSLTAQELLQTAESLFIGVAIASAAGWVWLIFRRWLARKAFLAPRPQRVPYWSLAEFFVGAGLMLVCLNIVAFIAHYGLGVGLPAGGTPPDGERGQPSSNGVVVSALVGTTVHLAVLACLMVWMGLTRRESLARWGLWPSWGDVRLGLVASLLILPPTLLLNQLLNQFVAEYKHTVLEAVRQNPTLAVFLSLTVSVAIVTPIFEEFLFRGLLQGGLQKLARRRLVAERERVAPEDQPSVSELVTPAEVAAWRWAPVVISSAIFAGMHFGQGAAPIALFFFALALGYLYRQTGRLWPCITVHFMLNLFSMVMLGLQVAAGPGE